MEHQLQTATVVTLPVAKKRREPAYDITESTMMHIRMRMYGWDPKDLAAEMGVSTACVYALRAGRTVWPRPKTMVALLKALSIELRLYDRATGIRIA